MRFLPCTLLLLQAAASTAVGQTPKTVRRQPVTPELERTAFADARARTLLERARAARTAQDSALRAYDAKTYQRLTVGMSIRRLGRERVLVRTEQAARVRWARGSGLLIEPTGRRAAAPTGASLHMDLTLLTPIPYFPGREALWLPSAYVEAAQAEVDEDDMLHPLATGAEAYYRYATGDSLSLRLPDGRTIALRELRITARRPEFRAFVGSFWFDVERGHLVRAAYRTAAELDIWRDATEEQKRKVRELEERARTDTGAAAQHARREAKRVREEIPSALTKVLVGPMRAKISSITVEYGLHEARFWLPKRNVAEAEAQVSFLRIPVKVEESFQYASVNASDAIPVIPTPAEMGFADADTSDDAGTLTINLGPGRQRPADTSMAARATREDSLLRTYTARVDSLRAAAEQARVKGDSARARELSATARWYAREARQIARRREACGRGDIAYYAGTASRYDGALRMVVRMPCDTSRLAVSPDLPRSIFEPGEEVVGTEERDELLKTLDFSLQPPWVPQRPVLQTGLDLVRYNRVEGLSVGGSATSVLGMGYSAQAVARIGTADWVPNGDLSISRSNGRREVRLGVFHRLGVANDDWGAPLSFGASLANALYGRDEGFYYRTWGAELASTRDAPGPLGGATLLWRMFVERQRTAGREPNTQVSLGNAVGATHFERNIDAAQLTALGAGGELTRTFGADPSGFRLDTRLRSEAAFTDRSDSLGSSGYGRFVVDGTLSRGLGRVAASLTAAAGMSAGDLPPQRAFYVGGLQTVRGQFARPEGTGRVGDALWLGRAELGLGLAVVRPAVFYDIGWAGPRADFAQPGRPLSGAGVGLSLLDGLVRIDVARGIWPEKRWRADLYLDARF